MMNEQTQEALKMAIDFIEEITNAAGKYTYVNKTSLVADSYSIASKLKEALEQQEQEFFKRGKEIAKWADEQNRQEQEPVAYLKERSGYKILDFAHYDEEGAFPVYTHPAKQLSDDDDTEFWEKLQSDVDENGY